MNARRACYVALAAFIAAIVCTTAMPAFGRSPATTPWISLHQPAGLAAIVQPSLGSSVSFDTVYPSNVRNPRIEVVCYQNGSLVYGEAGSTTFTFVLGGASSLWLANGGSADCTANLFYFGQKAGSQTYNFLASTSFTAG